MNGFQTTIPVSKPIVQLQIDINKDKLKKPRKKQPKVVQSKLP